MTDYPYAGTLIADPVTFQRAPSAQITVYDINDQAESTPLALKDLTGLPLPNPLTSSGDAFVRPFVAQVDGVKLVGAGLTVTEYSHKGMRDAAEAAAAAAQSAATNAADAAQADLAARIAAGQFVGAPGQDGSNVLPTDTAIKNAITTPGTQTAAALAATILALTAPAVLDGGNATSDYSGTFNLDGGSAA